MLESYIGEIRIYPYNQVPSGWLICDGSLLRWKEHAFSALFTLLGTRYGGDGVNTFAIPDLRGRIPVHFSRQIPMGMKGGNSAVTLKPENIPSHSHALYQLTQEGLKSKGRSSAVRVTEEASPAPVSIMPPHIPMVFAICYEGRYPDLRQQRF